MGKKPVCRPRAIIMPEFGICNYLTYLELEFELSILDLVKTITNLVKEKINVQVYY